MFKMIEGFADVVNDFFLDNFPLKCCCFVAGEAKQTYFHGRSVQKNLKNSLKHLQHWGFRNKNLIFYLKASYNMKPNICKND